MDFEAPLPEDMEITIDKWRNYAQHKHFDSFISPDNSFNWFSNEFLINLKKLEYENGHFTGKIAQF